MIRPAYVLAAAALLAGLAFLPPLSSARPVTLPDPAVDEPAAASSGSETIVLAGGCFWGMQAVFQRVKGVTRVTAGYSGGEASTAHYEMVGTGRTGHAESVEIVFDPARTSIGRILKVFFSVAHDPTELNRQGPDTGTEYRSVIFFATPEQERVAHAYVAQLGAAKVFPSPIVTEVAALKGFYAAEAYHQDFVAHHPNYPYVVYNDLPKLAALEQQLPELYAAK